MSNPEDRDRDVTDRSSVIDLGTVAAVAVVTYVLANVVHEGLGHGGTCLLFGGHPRVLTSTYFDDDGTTLSPTGNRAVAAGGTLANLLFGFLTLIFLQKKSPKNLIFRLFLCLFAAVNLFQGAGYLLVSPFGNFGDWAGFLHGLEPLLVWKLLLTALGAGMYFGIALAVLPQFSVFVGCGDFATRRRRMAAVTLLPYCLGALLLCVAGGFNPAGAHLVVISAAASTLGGTVGLPWLLLWLRPEAHPRAQEAHGVPRDIRWLIAAVLVAILFVGILGPGISLDRTAHR